MKTMKFLMAIALFGAVFGSCKKEETAWEKNGIYMTGKESELNGNWSGKISNFARYYITLDEGKVVSWTMSGAYTSFSGDKGYYSFDGTNFEAYLFSDRIEATVTDNEMSGTYTENGSSSRITLKR